MIMSGLLTVNSGVSRLNGVRLAIQGAGNPFGAATNFLANRGLKPNNPIWVDGSNGFVGNVPVIFITNAGSPPPPPLLADAQATEAVKTGAGKGGAKAASGGRKGTAAAGKRTGAKAAKKSSAGKSGTKKAAAAKKRAQSKGGAKKSGGRSASTKRSAKRASSKKSEKGSRKRQ